jgi:hypothetical protein
MKQHLCYYCNQETVKDVVLVTFYTKKCDRCMAKYHLDWSDRVTLVILESTIKNGLYFVRYDVAYHKIGIFKRRDKIVWDGNNSAEILPIKIVEFDGDHKAINPSNLDEKLKTILTFL